MWYYNKTGRMTISTLFKFKGNETSLKHPMKCNSVSLATKEYLCHLGNAEGLGVTFHINGSHLPRNELVRTEVVEDL